MPRKNAGSANDAAQLRTAPLGDNAHSGLARLWQAYKFSREAGADLWDFALEINRLYESGITVSDIRWLVAKRYVQHGQETSVYGGSHRTFHRGDGFFFDLNTCVVLTSSGAVFVEQLLNQCALSERECQLSLSGFASHVPNGISKDEILSANGLDTSAGSSHKPHWDSARRELTLNEMVVKRFRVPAENQELILAAFEEEGWPRHIDDPLPIRDGIDPQTRLHDAINRLNGCQTNRLLCFRGNGNGTGVLWEILQAEVLRETVNSGIANM